MSLFQVWRLLACTTLFATGFAALARPLGGREERALPSEIRQVLAMSDGSALVLGHASSALVRIDAEGSVGSLEHPDAGALLHAVARGKELWVVGTNAVLRRGEDGLWARLAFAAPQAEPRHGWWSTEAVLLANGRTAVFRKVEDGSGRPGTQLLMVDSAMGIEQQHAYPGVVFISAVGDGADGIWALAHGIRSDRFDGDSLLGYAHFSNGRWTLWRRANDTREYATEEMEIQHAALPARLDALAPDGGGGAYGIWMGGLFHIDRDGLIRQLGKTFARPRNHHDSALAFDPAAGEIAVFAMAYGGNSCGQLTRIAPDGRIIRVDELPYPDWFAQGQYRPSVFDATLSIKASDAWISAGPFVFAVREGSDPIAYSTPEVRQRALEREHEVETAGVREGLLQTGSLVLSASLLLGLGAFGASRAHDERFLATGGEALGGAVLSLLPAFGLIACSPAEGWGPGMGGGMKFLCFGASAIAAPLLAGLGTWASGELLRGSQSPGAAFGGAAFGGAVGALLSIGASFLLKDLPMELRPVVLGLTLGLIGSGATLGYQLLGGGPRAQGATSSP